DEDFHEVEDVAPAVEEFLERLDRAGGDRSGPGAEAEVDRAAAQVAEPQRPAVDALELEIGSQLAGPDATGGERRFRVGEEVPGAEALEVVVVHGGSWLLVGAGPVGRECNGCTRGQGVRRSTGQPAGRCRR